MRVMGVSRSGFYDSLNRPPSQRSRRGDHIRKSVAQVHQETDAIYGSTKIAEELNRRDDVETDCRNRMRPALHMFNYIEIGYNERRRHQTFAWVSPSEFEIDFYNRITRAVETIENSTTVTAV